MTVTPHAHVGRKLIDASGLPTLVHGHRDPLWWGVWMLIVIEAMMFSLLATSYLYLRGNFSEWPPTGAANPPLAVSGATVLALLVSSIPMWIAFRAAKQEQLRPVQLGMLATTAVSAVALVLRAWEFRAFGYTWHSHAYGSVVWAMYFMHTLHLLSGVVENAVMTALVCKGPVERKHMLDIRLGGIYWWFVVASWIVIWAMVMFDDLLFRNSFVR
jgi:cytochrome c oxidase subunit 3